MEDNNAEEIFSIFDNIKLYLKLSTCRIKEVLR